MKMCKMNRGMAVVRMMRLSYIPYPTPLDNPALTRDAGLFTIREIAISNLTDVVLSYIRDQKASKLSTRPPLDLYNLLFSEETSKAPRIPTYSYISDSSQISLNEELAYLLRSNFSYEFGDPKIVYGQQIFFTYNKDKPALPGFETNKIHLQVKHEYILHCMIRLAGLTRVTPGLHALFPDNKLTWKVYFWNRDSNLLPGDTILRGLNSGVAATFVIYVSSDRALMKRVIQWLLERFPDHDELGLMDLRGTDTLTAGHVRLNRMMSYGADRGALQKARNENAVNWTKHVPYVMPPWIRRLQERCDNEASQLYIGKDVCDGGKPIDFETLCNTPFSAEEQANPISRNYCYMSPDIMNPQDEPKLKSKSRSRSRSRSKSKSKSRSKSSSGSKRKTHSKKKETNASAERTEVAGETH